MHKTQLFTIFIHKHRIYSEKVLVREMMKGVTIIA